MPGAGPSGTETQDRPRRSPGDQPTARIAVVGMGYWGKNLVRNFSELGSLAAICDTERRRGHLPHALSRGGVPP